MLKTHMAACLVATALASVPAIAQTPPPPSGGTDRPLATGSGSTTAGSSAMQPTPGGGTVTPSSSALGTTPGPAGTTSNTAGTASGSESSAPSTMGTASGNAGTAAPQPTASRAGSASGQFPTQMQPNQLMASKLMGTTVVGTNNESIGDVNDVILDRNGQAIAVVIGVGGFLGIGEKDVAVPFQQLDFVSSRQTNQQTSAAQGGTGTVSTTGSTGTNAGSQTNDGGVPDRVMLRMTKAELQAAPTFARSNRGDTSSSPPTGATTAPKP